MKIRRVRRYSIKTRVTLFTLVIFLLGLWSLTFYTSRMLREDIQHLLANQQFSTVSFIAAGVNDELAGRLDTLDKTATGLAAFMTGKPAALQAHLEQLPTVQALFNGGTYLTRADGSVVASIPFSSERFGVSYLDRDYIAGALKDGKATIGQPVIGKKLHTPIIGMAVPIRDDQGRVVGALAGVIDLSRPSFLDKLTGNRYGKTGGYLLVDSRLRIVVAATDKKALMVPIPPPGVSRVIDRFIAGYEGSDIFINPRGDEVLASAKGVPLTGGYVTAQLPTQEAFAPIREMQQRMLVAALFLTLLTGGLTWWMLRRQLSPMFDTAEALTQLSYSDEKPRPLPIVRNDEIGLLIGSFNHLLETLALREEALSASESRARAILQASPVPLAINDAHGKIISLNRAFVQVLGYSQQDIPTLEAWWERAYPEAQYRQLVVDQWQQHIDEANRTGKPFSPMEVVVRCKDETHRTFICTAAAFEGDFSGDHLVILFDITERKKMENQVREMAFHDSLTGLPNRRLLADRLAQTVAFDQRSGCHSALMFIDLDNFKPLNDTHGHEVGDQLLTVAASRLKTCVREMDTVARIGGDEFVVLLTDLDTDETKSTEQARIVAEKIRHAISAPYRLPGKRQGQVDTTVEHLCTASIGVALFMEGQLDDILIRADAAMYSAKEAGPNLIRFAPAQDKTGR